MFHEIWFTGAENDVAMELIVQHVDDQLEKVCMFVMKISVKKTVQNVCNLFLNLFYSTAEGKPLHQFSMSLYPELSIVKQHPTSY